MSGDTSVSGVAQAMWRRRPRLAAVRFALQGWRYVRQTDLACPRCEKWLHGLARVCRVQGRRRVQCAAVCPNCRSTFTMRQLRVSRRRLIGDHGTDVGHDETDVAGAPAREVKLGQLLGLMSYVSPDRDPVAGRDAASGPGEGPQVESRPLYWCKTTNPFWTIPEVPYGTDVRVLMPEAPDFDRLWTLLTGSGISCRRVGYWVEDEIISTVGPDGRTGPLWATTTLTVPGARRATWRARTPGHTARDARDAFQMVWDAHGEAVQEHRPVHVPAAGLVPELWLDYLPFDTLNPAQVQAVPAVLNSDGHLVITAPTGAGKTVVGMLAVLRTILGEGRKAAWLVPQRSLTDELDRELESWRGKGLRVERLSGEHIIDLEKIRAADLWVATTEKFESICRTSSLQAALGEVGCLVVDEVHLLGSPGRGPLLEALLARVRGADSRVRIVGLSATVSNAEEIAGWLAGRLITTTWRPTRLTWQLPCVPAYRDHLNRRDRRKDDEVRTRAAVALTLRVTDAGGSVLVFCGSKHNVRTTALALAAARGVHTRDIKADSDDIDSIHKVCAKASIGLHYKGWEFRREAETRFRAHDFDILVATTTVAAGVNLPARAVVVRDTQVGLDKLDVATALQMFGRAGRVGAGELEGWAYLIADETEHAGWQRALVDGYTVGSRIHATLPDHVLAEVVQGNITSVEQAEHWWRRTLCQYQGDDDTEPVVEAVDFLTDHGYLTQTARPDGSVQVTVTDLGLVTARLMVGTEVGADIRDVLNELAVPSDPGTAEDILIRVVATLVPELAFAPVADNLRSAVSTVVEAGGRRDRMPRTITPRLGIADSVRPGDLAQAALMLAAHSPHSFTHGHRMVGGLPSSTIFPILDQAPRYFAWLAAQGHLAAIHPWIAIVAADIERRVRWRRLGPRRGAGRLLWMCEEMATPAETEEYVPVLWRSATGAGVTDPDWPGSRPPRYCRLGPEEYAGLLRARTTGCELTRKAGEVRADAVAGVLVTWTGRATASTVVNGGASVPFPSLSPGEPDDPGAGAAIFTKRGDYKALGWLDRYHGMAHWSSEDS
ncbi:hypothetical protein GCM10009677_00460 [Sphaerisporangium rubeum]